jgi:aspartyl protease family protein
MRHIILFAITVLVLAGIVPRFLDRVGGAPTPPGSVAAAPSAGPAPTRRTGSGTAQVRSDRSGHFLSDIEVHGRTLKALVDTGATTVALRYEDARDIGLLRQERFDRQVATANGTGLGMLVRLNDVRIGDVVVFDVEALVLQRGALSTNLLGMSFLRRLSRFEVRNGVVVLEQ